MPVAVAAAGKPNGLTAAVPAAHKRQSAPLRLASEASCLPPELWSLVLAQLPSTELQRTALALSRAIPNAGVSLEVSLACLLSASCDFEMLKSISVIASFLAKTSCMLQQHLFSHVRITRDVQPGQLIRRLGPRYPDADLAASLCQSITSTAWRADSTLLVNLVNRLSRDVRAILLNLGALAAPEHLEELLDDERPKLERLVLRFNPYVDKASYTIFLKGLYFDTGILSLARWPVTPTFARLSLVQDPIPSYRDLVAAAYEAGLSAPSKAHAQPIVFFKLSCLSTLAVSPVAAHVSSLRLRIPGRSVMVPLSSASTSSTTLPPTHSAALPKPFPGLEHLDISTTYVGIDGAFQGLLKRHPGLRHLVVDRSGLIRFGMAEQTCAEIGRTIASIGVARANEAMKVFRAAMRAQQARAEAQRRAAQLALSNGNGEGIDGEHMRQLQVEQRMQDDIRAARRGRSGFATERRVRSAHVAPGAGASGNAELDALNEQLANLVVGSSPTSNGSNSSASQAAVILKPVILPSAPALLSLACGVAEHADLDSDLREESDAEFQLGYNEGKERVIATIREKLDDYSRLVTRARNAGNNHRSSAEDRIYPTLVRFRTPSERKERQKRAAELGLAVEDLDERKDILSVLDLVPCEVAGALELIDQVNEATCELCTIVDCAGQGRIATSDSNEEESKERARWRRPEKDHKLGCGHLIGRRIWNDE